MNSIKKPKTITEYTEWAKNVLFTDFEDSRSKNIYTVNLQAFFNTVSEHDFFKGLDEKLSLWSEEYKNQTTSQLLMDNSTLNLLTKTYESALDKSFRENILLNKSFPEPPKKGWVTADNLFKHFNDGLRGLLVCKFIDGPSFLADKLSAYANQLGLQSRQYSQARDDGYYAYHFYVSFKVELIEKDWKKQESKVEIEIQITTQLQEVLRSLTHQFYEQKRLQIDVDTSKWKWNYTSNQFKAGYLSHTLHLLEAIIIQLREYSRKEDSESLEKE